MQIKKIVVMLAVLLGTVVFSQELKLVYDSGHFSNFQIEGDRFNVENKYGTLLGLTYSYYIGSNYGIAAGLQYSHYNTRVSLKSEEFTKGVVHDNGSAFILNLSTKGYNENLLLNSIEIPIKFFYDTSREAKSIGYYVGIGAKWKLPIYQKSVISIDELRTSGFYPGSNVTIDNIKSHGFGEWNKYQTKQNTSFGSSIAVTGEFGFSFKVQHDTFYLGVFGDYSITDMNKGGDVSDSVVEFNPKGTPKEGLGITNLKEVGRIGIASFGIQFKGRFF